MSFERARAVADAVLFEGYALYPYRPSSQKNNLRWQFGVLAPRDFAEVDGGDPSWMEAQILVEEPGSLVRGTLRFLRLRRRRVLAVRDGEGVPVDSVDVDGRLVVSWDEGEVHEVPFSCPTSGEAELAVSLRGDADDEQVWSADGRLAATVQRGRCGLEARLRMAGERLGLAKPCARVRVRVENATEWQPGGRRDDAMAASLLGAHVLLATEEGRILSLVDPPEWAGEAAAACSNVRAFPVLVGDRALQNEVLASPIILYDFPSIAPESPGDLFDATEIDEILMLRTRAMTDQEKREARATDARVAALIDRVESIPDEALARLHGAFRDPCGRDRSLPRQGDRVRLRPGSRRRTDAQDMFLENMVATVRSLKHDVDGRACLAVTLDDDPAAELHLEHGRYHYFYLDEVEIL